MPLPSPASSLHTALRLADFANPESMRTLQSEIVGYAAALRGAMASPSVIRAAVREVVDDSLPTRLVTLRTSEDRARLLKLADDWTSVPGGAPLGRV